MLLPQTYTLNDLEAESGFDKRTIAYYIAEGLLPKVGRRGPKTRYSPEFLERLMFIRRVRDLQDAGKLRAVTLMEIRAVMNQLTAEDIRSVARSTGLVKWIRDRFEDPDWDTSKLEVAAEEVAASMPQEPDLDSWSHEALDASVAESSAPYEPRMVSASQRRGVLNEQIKPLQSQAKQRPKLERQQAQIEKFHTIQKRRMDELKHSIHRFEEHMEKMNYSLREEMRYEMREMKELVLGMHERLKKVEEQIKHEPETSKVDSDSSEG